MNETTNEKVGGSEKPDSFLLIVELNMEACKAKEVATIVSDLLEKYQEVKKVNLKRKS